MGPISRILERLSRRIVRRKPRYLGSVRVEAHMAAARDPYVRELVTTVETRRAAQRERRSR
jgi:hypothetical protein